MMRQNIQGADNKGTHLKYILVMWDKQHTNYCDVTPLRSPFSKQAYRVLNWRGQISANSDKLPAAAQKQPNLPYHLTSDGLLLTLRSPNYSGESQQSSPDQFPQNFQFSKLKRSLYTTGAQGKPTKQCKIKCRFRLDDGLGTAESAIESSTTLGWQG
jgi:hypothetical protein